MEGFHGQSSNHWTFGGALLYSVAILTTVGYGKLSPRTSLGKIITMAYAVIGVPLMLLLLSALGTLLANWTKNCYARMRCRTDKNKYQNTAVGYHKTPMSPCKLHEEAALIQIGANNEQRTLLATVRSSHSRGRCRRLLVKQTLTDSVQLPIRGGAVNNCIADVEEAEESEDNEHSHDTPSRVPLIYHPPPPQPPPSSSSSVSPSSVPLIFIIFLFMTYLCLGVATFASFGWNIPDAIYFCFLALSTIGIEEALASRIELFVCCMYLFVGLVVVAMCFSLVQEEVNFRCKQFAITVGLSRH